MESENVFVKQPIRFFFLSSAIFALASAVGHPSTLLAVEGRATPEGVGERVRSASGPSGVSGGPAASVLADPAINLNGDAAACVVDADCTIPIAPNTSVCRDGSCYARKGRFVSVSPNSANAGVLTARRVCVDAPGPGAHCWWVDAPGAPITHLGPGPQPLLTANLFGVATGTAVYRDWSADAPDSHGNVVVHIGGCPVSNGHDYYIQAIDLGANEADEASYSPALILPTQDTFGDVDGTGSTNIGDVFHLVSGFLNQQSLPRTWLKILPSGDNAADPGKITIEDVLGAVKGFQGQSYLNQPGGVLPSECAGGGPVGCLPGAGPTASIRLMPTGASGIEGVDWVAGPGPNDITLMHGGQDVAVEVFIENLGPNGVPAYQFALDCNYAFSVSGGIAPYSAECPIAGLPFDSGQCLGVDGDRPDWILANAAATVIACQTSATCPDGLSGKFICGAIVIAGSPGSGAGAFYGATFGFAVSADAEGIAVVGVDLDSNETLMVDLEGCPYLLDNVTPANIITEAGPCVCDADVAPCGAPNGLINLQDILVLTECLLEQADPCGGPFERCDVNCDGQVDFVDLGVVTLEFLGMPDACNTPAGACCKPVGGGQLGVHCVQFQQAACEFNQGAYEGDGTLCPIPTGEPCVVNGDCNDCQSCTLDVCDNGTCINPPDPRVCCHPITGSRTLIDDENPCTDDACDPETGQVTHVGSATNGVCASAQGSRYISATPPCGLSGTCDETTLVAMSLAVEPEPGVTIDLGFIQPDGSVDEAPVFQTPSTWGSVDITGGFIRPSTTYIVTLVPMTGLAGSSSSSATTGIYADIDGNGTVNFADIQIVVLVFKGNPLFLELLGDISPCILDDVVNIPDDVFATVRAFLGETFEDACPLGVCCFVPGNPNSCSPLNDFGPGALELECPDPSIWTEGGECGPLGECP